MPSVATFARIGIAAFAGVAITLTAVELSQPAPSASDGSDASPVAGDPLRPRLIRCSEMGEAATDDQDCLVAWAENRRRFLAPGARPAERLPKSTDLHRAPTSPLERAEPR